jgi:hypothetical protein
VTDRSPTALSWRSLADAARLLALTPTALRRALERRAMRAPDGGVEAELDGVRGRKLGRLWRVQLGERWAAAPGGSDDVVPHGRRGGVRRPRTGEVR